MHLFILYQTKYLFAAQLQRKAQSLDKLTTIRIHHFRTYFIFPFLSLFARMLNLRDIEFTY